MARASRMIPLLGWLRGYRRQTAASDLLAAIIVTLMLIPQALAYAMLAGLPPQMGLYASLLPLVLYALAGSSASLAVGPVAIIALMTGSALSGVAPPGSAEYVNAALILAGLSGLILLAMGLLRLGFLTHFLSHPVITGFVTASGVLIAASQIGPLLGIEAGGSSLPAMGQGLWSHLGGVNEPTLWLGAGSLVFLTLAKHWLPAGLRRLGFNRQAAVFTAKTAPVMAVIATTLLAGSLDLGETGVALVGDVPVGLPPLALPAFDAGLWWQLLPAAVLISVVGFVESVSVAQTLAARDRQRIHPNRELIALGLANMGAAVSSAMPVSGGISRSVVNVEAGARTPMVGVFTALGMLVATLGLASLLSDLPRATLSATIIVAVGSLMDWRAIPRTLAYSRSDGIALLVTLAGTLLFGVEAGLLAGVTLSLGLHLYRTSRPHSAVVGRVPGTEHFRNVCRHSVETDEQILLLRIDGSLYFANARYLEDTVMTLVAERPTLTDMVLTCQAVNGVDASALESLETINARLRDAGIRLHLAEVKGPVMDSLQATEFYRSLTGSIHLSSFTAWQSLQGVAIKCQGRETTDISQGS